MKRTLELIAGVVSVMAFSAVAQEPAGLEPNGPGFGTQQTGVPRLGQLNDAAKASDVIGMTVVNLQDEKLGKAEEIAVDLQSGRVIQVIVSTGGFLGLGDSLRAAPPGAFHRDAAGKVLYLDASKDRWKEAPKFDLSKWAEGNDPDHLSAVYRHYGQENAYRFVLTGNAELDGRPAPAAAPNTRSRRRADGTWEESGVPSQSQSMVPVSHLSRVQKASQLMGLAVGNLADERLGAVDNILVDLPSGRVVAVVVSSGGFLGMGDELSAVPPGAFRFAPDWGSLRLDATKELLSAAPHFKASQWPDFREPVYVLGVYRAHRVEAYFTTNTPAAADNTARNVRDRGERTLTPLDQGGSRADIDTTARIRKEILAAKDMSVNARNVKIITIDGRVTLRGPVNTAEEKRRIAAIAVNIARPENVDDQLEVK